MARRPLVVLVLALMFAPVVAGCASRDDKLHASRRLTLEGTRLREEGLQTGNQESLEKGQKMIDKGTRLRESALEGM